MIAVQRRAEDEPPALQRARSRDSGLAKLERDVAALQAAGKAIDRKVLNSSIYGKARQPLWRIQHRKCCYCECELDESYNDVEHFRPWSRYWWLAYNWDNLLLACQYCNQIAKNDAFDVEPGSARLEEKQQAPGNERPLFIDPASEDPAAWIEFAYDERHGCWLPRPRNGDPRADYTITTLRLREARNRERRAATEQNAKGRLLLWKLAIRRGADDAELAEQRRQAQEMTTDDKPFAAMARAILAEMLEGA